jgi:YjbE family integral membrane protein|tara:strand:- start:1226 stop:1846 length:621 start_codon:yes stop_codon:yes gene_type:complete
MFEQFIVSIQIILIDIVMAADNAIIIGLIASSFAPNNRKRIIAWGIAAAFIFRIIFAFGAVYILEYPWIKILGGVLLLWIVNNLRQDFFNSKRIKSPNIKSQEHVSFHQGVYKVLIADFTLSLDNVLGVVGAAKDYYYLMVIGLLLSVFLVATLASYFANYIKQHRWLGYTGLFVIMVVALQLIIGGLINLEVLSINKSFESLFSI